MKFAFLALFGLIACSPVAPPAAAPAPAAVAQAAPAKPKTWTYQIVRTYPHDPTAFTEGLLFLEGYLYESTGLEGRSEIRKVKLETGEVVQRRAVPSQYFGEGMVVWKDRVLSLTWKHGLGFVYDRKTFEPTGQFRYPGEGWGLTEDGRRLIMSDGTSRLRFLDPNNQVELGSVTVTYQAEPVVDLNELEWVKGEVFANLWQTDRIVRIDPATGVVTGVIDLRGLLAANDREAARGPDKPEVLNGIAYDAKGDRLFVTGKFWPKLYEIKLVERLN